MCCGYFICMKLIIHYTYLMRFYTDFCCCCTGFFVFHWKKSKTLTVNINLIFVVTLDYIAIHYNNFPFISYMCLHLNSLYVEVLKCIDMNVSEFLWYVDISATLKLTSASTKTFGLFMLLPDTFSSDQQCLRVLFY